jgi:hypothetical protein
MGETGRRRVHPTAGAASPRRLRGDGETVWARHYRRPRNLVIYLVSGRLVTPVENPVALEFWFWPGTKGGLPEIMGVRIAIEGRAPLNPNSRRGLLPPSYNVERRRRGSFLGHSEA